jgi:iron complex transport system substrate-binding protein
LKILKLIAFILPIIFFLGCVKVPDKNNEGIRIIALSPSLVETVFSLGKGNNIVGASTFCDFPEEAKNIPAVANVSDINLEYALKLEPDIVLLMPSQNSIADKLNKLNIKTAVIAQESLNDIINSFEAVGKVIDAEIRGREITDSLRNAVEAYRSTGSGLKVMISVGREYGSEVSYIYSTGRNGFLSDIIGLLGHENVLETKISYPKIGAEAILELDPDIIIDLVQSESRSESELLKDWSLYTNTKAVSKGKIYIFRGEHTTIPGPRIFDLIKELKEKGL